MHIVANPRSHRKNGCGLSPRAPERECAIRSPALLSPAPRSPSVLKRATTKHVRVALKKIGLRTFTARTSHTSSARYLPIVFAWVRRGGESHTSSHEHNRAEPRATLFLQVLSEFAQRAVGCGVGYCLTLPKLWNRSFGCCGSASLCRAVLAILMCTQSTLRCAALRTSRAASSSQTD
jgi:hypothetical protein